MAEYWRHSFAYANVWRKTKSFGEKLIACIEYVLLSNLAERTGCSWWIWRLLNKIQVSMTQNHTTQTNHFFSKHIKVFLFLKFSLFCFQVLPNMLSLKGFGFIIVKQEKKYVDLHIFMVARTNCGRLNSVNKPAVKHLLCRTDHVLISNLKNS